MRNKRFGIQIDDSGDLVVKQGHLALGDTIAQNEFLLLVCNRGDLKENPLLGAGISEMACDNDVTGWKRKIIDALKDDGMKVNTIDMDRNGHINRLEAEY